MKKIFYIIIAVFMAVSCYDDSAILDRLDKLENQSSDIEAQIGAVKASITNLESIQKEIENTVNALEQQGEKNQKEIEALKEKHASLEKGINDLETLISKEISNTEDWARSTFATIEQYNSIVSDLSDLKKLAGDNYKELSDKIDESVSSIKLWVKEVLKGYYTSEEVDAKIKELQDSLDSFGKRIDELEKQMEALKESITSLESVYSVLKNTVDSLKSAGSDRSELIENLEEYSRSLGKSIKDLKDSLDNGISDTRNWVKSTYATLEQYNGIVKGLSDLNKYMTDNIESLKETISDNYEALINEISESRASIKNWVEETLKAYYTAVEIDGLLKDQSDEIQKLADSIRTGLDGLSERLDILENEIKELEALLGIITKEFSISFDDSETAILPGGTATVNYKIKGATPTTIVKAMHQNGWTATVNPATDSTGTITVYAPDPLTESEIVIIVYDGQFRTIMSSINFVTGVLTPSTDAVTLEGEAGTFSFSVNTNIDYDVVIPEEAAEWLSPSPSTKSMRTDELRFSYTRYEANGFRSTVICLNDPVTSKEIMSFGVVQKGLIPEIGRDAADNEILYTTTDGKKIELKNASAEIFGAELISNEYVDGIGVMTFKGDVTKIGVEAFNAMTNLETISISDKVTAIEEYAFTLCKHLKSIDLPKSLKVIGNQAFCYCFNLSSINIPEGVTTIGEYALGYCNSLESVTLPSGLTRINKCTFESCEGLRSVNIPESVTTIDREAFKFCSSLEYITLPSGLTSINELTFHNCFALKSITLPKNLTRIASQAFCYCQGLESIVIPEGVTSIGDGAFWSCIRLRSITLPEKLTEISGNTFTECTSLESVIIPEEVTSIGDEAFKYCNNLLSITIPEGVTSIGSEAFKDCTNLRSVKCFAKECPQGGEGMFDNNAFGRKIFVPLSSSDKYKNAEYWKDYASDIVDM